MYLCTRINNQKNNKMAKYINNKIKSGKLAGSVFTVRYGETIERAYNPFVSNPNTAKQVAARARMKLMSQLSAVLGDVIAMPRVGSVSSRNLFVKNNYGSSSYTNNQASVDLLAIKLTKSVVGFAPVSVTRGTGNAITAQLVGGAPGIDRVVYVQLQKDSDEELRVVGTKVVEKEGSSTSFQTTLVPADLETYVYAYGIRDNSDRARAIFGDLISPTGEDVAKLVVTRTLTEQDVTLTETVSAKVVAANAKNNEEVEDSDVKKKK